jgi:two-component system, chemotaxis family, chemotaxis protein CheY
MAASILIVDDSTSMRQSVRFILEQGGYEVTEASDGLVGFALQSAKKFNLILTDVNMPNMDGLTMLRKIRNESDNRFVPILVLTTESQGRVVEEGKNAGATGWIVKPFTNDALLSTVKKVIG